MKKVVFFLPFIILFLEVSAQRDSLDMPYRNMPEVYPGTSQLTMQGDLSVKMLDGAHTFIDRKIANTVTEREKLWNRSFSSPYSLCRASLPREDFFERQFLVDQ